jgi:hypothetical protein
MEHQAALLLERLSRHEPHVCSGDRSQIASASAASWRQLLKEWQNVPALELTANDYITYRVNSVDLKNRLGNIETDCRDRLHVWLLRIVGALTAPTSMALPCRWRSRPQHQKRT